MSTRLSVKQKEVLHYIANCCDSGLLGYSLHAEDMWLWDSLGELRRYMENLEARGFINIEKDHFYRITDAGRAAIGRSIVEVAKQ